MKKTILVKIDCESEKQIDKKQMNIFFDKMKNYLQLNNKLPIKELKNIKKRKI